jgi:hypothetical protein
MKDISLVLFIVKKNKFFDTENSYSIFIIFNIILFQKFFKIINNILFYIIIDFYKQRKILLSFPHPE